MTTDSSRLSATHCLYDLRETVMEHFPTYWPAVEAGLATTATLLLKDAENCTALVLVGGAGAGKTTVASMLDGAQRVYRSDNFTPAAFVSQHASKSKKQLAEIDMLPRIRYQLLLTPELATIFRGDPDDLEKNFRVLTRILDGQGYMTDMGSHGRRGYEGDYLFAWVGCTTPFSQKVWGVMAQLGSRLFFLELPPSGDVSVKDLAEEGVPYRNRLKACREKMATFLASLWAAYGGPDNAVRAVQWGHDPLSIREGIAELATVLAKLRGAYGRRDDSPTMPEVPQRANAVLRAIARGRALLYGRTQLAEEDLRLVHKITLDSVPYASVVREAVSAENGLDTEDIKRLTGTSDKTSVKIMQDLGATGAFTADLWSSGWRLGVSDEDLVRVFRSA